MTAGDRHRFQVDLRGIVDILSHHLYGSPTVYVRELLQNAVDAVTARRRFGDVFAPSILLEVSASRGDGATSLSVTDNGIGLTPGEVEEFLATIGRSSKVDELAQLRGDFLGQFGIGILACFVVSDEIAVITQSSRPNEPAVEWRGRPDGTYSLRQLARTFQPGTTVHLRPRPERADLMTEQTVVSLATRFGEFLPYPIEVRGGGPARVINERPFPWRDAALIGDPERRALLSDGVERFGVPVMDVFPIRAEPGGVEGLAYVLSTAPSPVSRPAHRVYLRGMLVSDQVNNLLPDWAFFVRCMVNTTSLRPTASREQLFDDELYRATRDELGVAVRRHLLELAEKDPDRLRRVVNTHDLGLRSLAAHDDEFLRIIAPWLPIHTALGPTTLGALVAENTTIHYTTTYEAFQQVSQIAAPLRLPVVNGGYVYAIDLLERLPEVYPGHEVLPLEADDLLDELEPITLEERLSLAPFLTLADAVLQPFRCRGELRRYQPAAMPAFLTLGDVARLRRAYEDSRLVADDLLRRVLDETAVDLGLEAAYGTLCFNYSNPMVRRLAEMPDQRLQADAIGLLYVQSLLLGRQPVSGKEMDMYSRTLLSLLERSLTGARQTAEEQR